MFSFFVFLERLIIQIILAKMQIILLFFVSKFLIDIYTL